LKQFFLGAMREIGVIELARSLEREMKERVKEIER